MARTRFIWVGRLVRDHASAEHWLCRTCLENGVPVGVVSFWTNAFTLTFDDVRLRIRPFGVTNLGTWLPARWKVVIEQLGSVMGRIDVIGVRCRVVLRQS